jgi:hypothetical protein
VSVHPEAVKARRWRERKRRERAGCVFVTVAVTSCHTRALRRLGLVAGDPDDWLEPRPDAASLAQAVQQLFDAAEPLAKVAGALRPADGGATGSNAGCLRTA